jgi:hypothetical protein
VDKLRIVITLILVALMVLPAAMVVRARLRKRESSPPPRL